MKFLYESFNWKKYITSPPALTLQNSRFHKENPDNVITKISQTLKAEAPSFGNSSKRVKLCPWLNSCTSKSWVCSQMNEYQNISVIRLVSINWNQLHTISSSVSSHKCLLPWVNIFTGKEKNLVGLSTANYSVLRLFPFNWIFVCISTSETICEHCLQI